MGISDTVHPGDTLHGHCRPYCNVWLMDVSLVSNSLLCLCVHATSVRVCVCVCVCVMSCKCTISYIERFMLLTL